MTSTPTYVGPLRGPGQPAFVVRQVVRRRCTRRAAGQQPVLGDRARAWRCDRQDASLAILQIRRGPPTCCPARGLTHHILSTAATLWCPRQAVRAGLDAWTAKLGKGDDAAQAEAAIGVEVHEAMAKAISGEM